MKKRRLIGFGVGVLVLAVSLVTGQGPASRWWQRKTREKLARECRAARDSYRWNDLQRLAADWAARDPEAADPWLFQAHVAESRRDWPGLAANLARVPEKDAKAIPAFIELAKLQFGPLNEPYAGEATCLKILRLEPRIDFAHQRLIQYYTMTLQREKLIAQVRAAIDVAREPPEAYVYLMLLNTLRMSNGVEFNERWLERYPDAEIFAVARAMQIPDPDDKGAVAPPDQAAVQEKAQAGKAILVESLLQKYPKNHELLSRKIEQAILVGDSDQVIELLARVADSAELDSRFWRYKGWVHETLDETKEAEAAYKRSLELHPLDWNTWNRLGVVYRRLKEVDKVANAIRLVEEAQSLRTRMLALPSAELVTPEILADLAKYARGCGANWLADPLDRRVKQLAGEE